MASRNIKQMLDLGGRIAVVTGGSRGLGLQIAESLGELGAEVAITARKKIELDEALAYLEKRGVKVTTWVSDLSRKDQIEPLVSGLLERYGKVDILVNNAGTSWGAPAETHPVEAWEKVMALNLTARFMLSQQIGLRSMIPQKWGRIINNASIAGLIAPDPRIMRAVAYNTSKAGVIGLTRSLAAEWGRHGITVNAICPGFFPSRMTGGVLDDPTTRFVLDGTPTGRLGNDEDLKGIVALMASEAGSHITGQALAIDGGATAI